MHCIDISLRARSDDLTPKFAIVKAGAYHGQIRVSNSETCSAPVDQHKDGAVQHGTYHMTRATVSYIDLR